MKKLFMLMISGLLVFTSCSLDGNDTKNDAETRRKIIATSMHNSNIGQIEVNLDPFNIAFRLNTLMVESEPYAGDVNHASLAEIRQNLFGAQTMIESDNQGVYTITLQGSGKYNFIHTGKLVIRTNGATLANGNSWSLDIPETASYQFSMSGVTVSLQSDSYTITSIADNKWAIQILKLVSKRPEMSGNELKSDWSGKITITQDQFTDQKLASVSKSTYSMDVESYPAIVTMYIPDTMYVSTKEPLRFNPACAQNQVVGSGSMSTFFKSVFAGPLDFTLSEWKGEGVQCDPSVDINFYGVVQE